MLDSFKVLLFMTSLVLKDMTSFIILLILYIDGMDSDPDLRVCGNGSL